MAKPYVNEMMKAQRVLSHGKIESLSTAFRLAKGHPFSLFIVPIDTAETEPVLVDCKLILDDESSDCPFNLRCWNEPAVIEISATGIDLGDYDVYWGTGSDEDES
jgi:hypothetical protein